MNSVPTIEQDRGEKIVARPGRHSRREAIEFRLGALLNDDDVVRVEQEHGVASRTTIAGPVFAANFGTESHDLCELRIILKCSGDLVDPIALLRSFTEALLEVRNLAFKRLETVLERRWLRHGRLSSRFGQCDQPLYHQVCKTVMATVCPSSFSEMVCAALSIPTGSR